MAVNSYKDDEHSSTASNRETVQRLLRYLLAYKKQIILVMCIMAYCSAVALVNPLFMEAAIDTFIANQDMKGLMVLILAAIGVNVIGVILVRIRMLTMAGVCNKILLTIRQELYTHIQTLDFHFFCIHFCRTERRESRICDTFSEGSQKTPQYLYALAISSRCRFLAVGA